MALRTVLRPSLAQRVARRTAGVHPPHRLAAATGGQSSFPVTTTRWCASTASSSAPEAPKEESQQRWDITDEKWVDFKYTEADFARFPGERALFRSEPLVKLDAVPEPAVMETMDTSMALRGAVSSLRAGDCYATEFEELLWERMAECVPLLNLLAIPQFEDKSVVQEMHSKAVPGEGTYLKVRTQSYWLALHVWLIHYKQHAVQEGEGLFGSALCALLTRRLFEFQWNRIRMFLHAADVPIMSVANELEDMQEFIFGLCVALDDVFREEASSGTAAALLKEDAELGEKQLGLAPRLKYVLWANVYSGGVEHDDKHLHQLTVYLLRQRIFFEKMGRNTFLSCKWNWADHPVDSAPEA